MFNHSATVSRQLLVVYLAKLTIIKPNTKKKTTKMTGGTVAQWFNYLKSRNSNPEDYGGIIGTGVMFCIHKSNNGLEP